jgi:hypothetical protein
MSTSNLEGVKYGLRVSMTTLLPSMSRLSTCGSLDVSQSYGHPMPLTGKLCLISLNEGIKKNHNQLFENKKFRYFHDELYIDICLLIHRT